MLLRWQTTVRPKDLLTHSSLNGGSWNGETGSGNCLWIWVKGQGSRSGFDQCYCLMNDNKKEHINISLFWFLISLYYKENNCSSVIISGSLKMQWPLTFDLDPWPYLIISAAQHSSPHSSSQIFVSCFGSFTVSKTTFTPFNCSSNFADLDNFSNLKRLIKLLEIIFVVIIFQTDQHLWCIHLSTAHRTMFLQEHEMQLPDDDCYVNHRLFRIGTADNFTRISVVCIFTKLEVVVNVSVANFSASFSSRVVVQQIVCP